MIVKICVAVIALILLINMGLKMFFFLLMVVGFIVIVLLGIGGTLNTIAPPDPKRGQR